MILRANWVIRVSAPPIRDGFVEIDGARIKRVGAASELRPREGVVDLGDVVLTPGLVNPHTHLELTCYAGMAPPSPFWPWIQQMIQLRAAPGQREREHDAVIDGAWRSLRAGVTCVGDISRLNLAWRALKPLPIRKVCFAELLSLADDPPRNPEELRAVVAEMIEDELLTIGVTPHAPYTVPVEQFRAAIALAEELQRPWTTHLAETREEIAFLSGEKGALGPMIEALLDQCGVSAPRMTPTELLAASCAGPRPGAIAHGNYLTDAEFDYLAEAGHTIVYCPRAHRFFGHTPHPFARMRAAGVRVAIGADSLASNYSLSMLDELQFMRRELTNAPSPAELLQMATLDAARALGSDGEIGSLDPGKQADLAAFPCTPNANNPLEDLIKNAPPPVGVWVAGRKIT